MKQSVDLRLEAQRLDRANTEIDADLSPIAIRHRNNIIKLMDQLVGRHNRWEVFRHFVTMSAVALSKLDVARADDREALYMDCVSRYTREESSLFAHMFAELTAGMDACPRDILGEVYMLTELGNARMGQFFTPYHLCQLMASLSVTDAHLDTIREQGFMTLSEPACGAGAMVIAFTQELRKRGVNYQQSLHVTATDLDSMAAMMAYIQLSLLHVPAVVINGNSLTLKEYDHWYTPAHIVDLWNVKLARRDREQSQNDSTHIDAEEDQESPGMQ